LKSSIEGGTREKLRLGRLSISATASEETIDVREAVVEVKIGSSKIGTIRVLALSRESGSRDCDASASGSEVVSGVSLVFKSGVGVEVRLSDGGGRSEAGESAEDKEDDSRSHYC
jgi:hypothetical protein